MHRQFFAGQLYHQALKILIFNPGNCDRVSVGEKWGVKRKAKHLTIPLPDMTGS